MARKVSRGRKKPADFDEGEFVAFRLVGWVWQSILQRSGSRVRWGHVTADRILKTFSNAGILQGRLCGPVIGVPDHKARNPGSIPGTTTFFLGIVGLERGPLSLVSTIKELLGRKSDSGHKDRHADHVASYIRKNWH
jgi:hypothetical protein